MALNEWDEDSLVALYRRYQAERDNIPWARYQPIISAAREMVAGAESEQRMAAISEQANRMYVQQAAGNDREAAVAWTARGKAKQGLRARVFSDLAALFRDFIDSINPARWVPVAVTAALLAAVLPFVVTQQPGKSDSAELVASHLPALQNQHSLVSRQLGALNELQMGFASSASDFSRAFNAGMLFVDIISLSANPDDPLLQRAVTRIRQDLNDTITGISDMERAELGDRLQAYYSDNPMSSVFVFGQWVETAYLLAGIGAETGDLAALEKVLGGGSDMADLLRSGNQYQVQMDTEFGELDALVVNDGFRQGELDRVSAILLKMRTIYALR